MDDFSFYKGKRVFITGHTGFKGSWLCKMLVNAGAKVTGYSLAPPTEPNLFTLSGLGNEITSVIGDIRDFSCLKNAFDTARPEIVFHLAAQPLVLESYKDPVSTYEINVMGTVHLLECIRRNPCVRSFLNVTTDKVYQNKEWVWGYRETESLDGFDPYSNSKSCSELATHSYLSSFFTGKPVAISTARAGNVIGGGDFSKDRIIPDCVRAAKEGSSIVVRNPDSVRPYQHVLEPLTVYLMIAQSQYLDKKYAGNYNVGPDESGCVTTGKLAELFCEKWADGLRWETQKSSGPHEADLLKLDCSKLKSTFKWKPCWSIETAVEKTVEWTKVFLNHGNIPGCMDWQIKEYLKAWGKTKCLTI